jgi:hypothetical protein
MHDGICLSNIRKNTNLRICCTFIVKIIASMKTLFVTLFLAILLVSCKEDDSPRNNNPNLIDPVVNVTLNLNLPEYNPLKFPGNSIVLNGQGISGIVVYNINNDLYTALELSDPNHPTNNCSKMTVAGPIATCPCETDTNEYFITSGQHTTDENLYPMQPYYVIRTGDNIKITN